MTDEENKLVIGAVGAQRIGARLNAWLTAALVEAVGEEEALAKIQTQFPTVPRALLERMLGAGRNIGRMKEENLIELSLELFQAMEAKGQS